MFYRGVKVKSVSIRDALAQFLDFLGSEAMAVVAVGHNVKVYDCPILLNAVQACGMDQRLRDTVHGFVDTLPLFQQVFKKVNGRRKSCALPSLYQHYFEVEMAAHDAEEHAKVLQEIVEAWKAENAAEAAEAAEAKFRATLNKHSFTWDTIL